MVKNADNIASGGCFLLLARHKNNIGTLGEYEVKPRFLPKMAPSRTVMSLPFEGGLTN